MMPKHDVKRENATLPRDSAHSGTNKVMPWHVGREDRHARTHATSAVGEGHERKRKRERESERGEQKRV